MSENDVTTVLKSSGLLQGMAETLIAQLGAAFEERRLASGADLVRQGDDADHLFVIAEGKLDVLLDTMRLQQLGPGAVVGEVALLAGGKRSATVRAIEPTRALALSRERFDRLLEEHPELASVFSGQLQQRIRRVHVARYLEELLGKLDPESLAEIESQITWKHLSGGDVLFRNGDPSDGAYIVASGRLRVTIPDRDTGERLFDEVGPGQWIGEMGLITRSPRAGSVTAVRDTDLVFVSQDVFDRLVLHKPAALAEATRMLITRLQRQMTTDFRNGTELRTLAIVPATSGLDITKFTEDLVAMLGGFGKVQHLTAERVDSLLAKRGIARCADQDPMQLRLAAWLVDQESAHHYVVYQADHEWTPWSERTVRYADHVLVVADGDASPNLGDGELKIRERFANGRAPRTSLVLLHASKTPGFAGTARFLDARKVDAHYHVRRGVRADVARIARILTNNAIGVVFGGGGSRGYAHIGVVRAFEELGIPVDAVGGSSIGAVIGGAYAMGMSSQEMLTTCAPILAGFLDPTLPFVSLMSGKRATEGVAAVTGGLEIEDLITLFFCMSTNLTRGGPVVHRRGSLTLAARASGAVPGIFPPLPMNGDLLVDGGLANNLPVDVMRTLIGGSVIAVDVIPDIDLQSSGELPPHLSGWNYMWSKINPFAPKLGMPNILSILMRSVMVASRDVLRAEEKLTTLYLRPPVDKWNMLDFKSAAPIAEQGYRGTFAKIKAWWETARASHVV